MYPVELEIKDTTEGQHFCFLPRFTFVDREGRSTSYFHLSTNVTISISISQIFRSWVAIYQLSPSYGVFISQLMRYARACSLYECFSLKATRLSNNFFEHGYVKERLKSSLKKFYGRYGDLFKQYEVLSQMTICSLTKYNENPPPIRLYTNWWPFSRTRSFTDLWEVSIEHLRRV